MFWLTLTVKNACFVWNSSVTSGWVCSSLSLDVWPPALSLCPEVNLTCVSWSPPDGQLVEVSRDASLSINDFIITCSFKYGFKCGFSACQDVYNVWIFLLIFKLYWKWKHFKLISLLYWCIMCCGTSFLTGANGACLCNEYALCSIHEPPSAHVRVSVNPPSYYIVSV